MVKQQFYLNLKRCLHSDPEFIAVFDNYEIEPEEDEEECVPVKRFKVETSEDASKLGNTRKVEFIWKVVFEIDEKEFKEFKSNSKSLLDLIFSKKSKKLLNLLQEQQDSEVCLPLLLKKSVFNVSLNMIPSDFKCQNSELPRVIVELIRLLLQEPCLKTIGAFRIEALSTKTAEMESKISSGYESFDDFELSQISNIGKMSLLKRFFRQIPGQLVNKRLTTLIYSICVEFDTFPFIDTMIRWALSCMTFENYKTLAFICLMLNSYAKHEQFNLMTAESLAICWCPVIFDINANIDMFNRITKVLSLFIKNWEKFFRIPIKSIN